SEWNLLWEAGVLRHGIAELHPRLHFLKNYPGRNITLVPRDEANYMACEPLYHLLSKPALDRFGLPPISRGAFPPSASRLTESPADTEQRLSHAFAHHVWPLLCSGS